MFSKSGNGDGFRLSSRATHTTDLEKFVLIWSYLLTSTGFHSYYGITLKIHNKRKGQILSIFAIGGEVSNIESF